jgi:hypothetical protein
VILESMSTSSPASIGNLDLLVVGINSTLFGSAKMAVATALHISTSKPIQFLSSSMFAKPIRGSETPQIKYPLSLTSSSTEAFKEDVKTKKIMIRRSLKKNMNK